MEFLEPVKSVIPAKAGIHASTAQREGRVTGAQSTTSNILTCGSVDPGLRRDDTEDGGA
jgi:hypothetical protein